MKEDFLAIGEKQSNVLVKKIITNIIMASKNKQSLISQIELLKDQIKAETDNTKINGLIEHIIDLESKLDKYCMVGQSELDKIYNSSSLEKIVSLIEQANKLLN